MLFDQHEQQVESARAQIEGLACGTEHAFRRIEFEASNAYQIPGTLVAHRLSIARKPLMYKVFILLIGTQMIF
jgi:exoribonuclease II